ncbi:MAG: hypothetical protein MJA83_05060, partial [Gammaproteobacteria bacterium]|nr:hypothetical protein [Gammaproteobacteria bacterium]
MTAEPVAAGTVANNNRAQAVRALQVRILYKHGYFVVFANFAVATAMMLLLLDKVATLPLYIWTAVVYAVSIFRLVFIIAFHRKELSDETTIRWGWYAVGSAFLSGLLWGAVPVLFIDFNNAATLVIIAI